MNLDVLNFCGFRRVLLLSKACCLLCPLSPLQRPNKGPFSRVRPSFLSLHVLGCPFAASNYCRGDGCLREEGPLLHLFPSPSSLLASGHFLTPPWIHSVGFSFMSKSYLILFYPAAEFFPVYPPFLTSVYFSMRSIFSWGGL